MPLDDCFCRLLDRRQSDVATLSSPNLMAAGPLVTGPLVTGPSVTGSSVTGPVQLLWQDQSSGAVSDWWMDGPVITGPVITGPVGDGPMSHVQGQSIAPIDRPDASPNWQLVGNADVDRDGTIDWLWRNPVTGQNRFIFGHGGGEAGLPAANNLPAANLLPAALSVNLPTVADAQWQVVAMQDFNQDGSADIGWRHQGSGENRVWLMNGRQVKWAVDLPSQTDLTWELGGVADFNHDGSVDWLWRNPTLGDNVIWLMNGFERAQDLPVLRLDDPAWHMVGVADMNQDGQADIVWRHDIGVNSVWLMRDGAYQSGMLLPSVSDPGWHLATIVSPSVNPSVNLGTNPGVNSGTNPDVNLAVRTLAINPPKSSPVSDLAATMNPIAPDLTIGQLSLPTAGFKPGDVIPVNVQVVAANAIAINDPVKVSFFLSQDANISRRDRFLDAVIVDPAANAAASSGVINAALSTRSLQLPGIQDDFWHVGEDGLSPENLNKTAYIGVLIDSLGATPEVLRENNQKAQAIAVTLPGLVEYDFVYDYDGATRSGDFYRGSVVADEGTYQVNQVIDPIPDVNQSGKNGTYRITDRRAYSLDRQRPRGDVSVVEYYDAETQTRYIPNSVIGRNYLGSESGYIRPRQSNTDRFGNDFYEADVWLTRPLDPSVGTVRPSRDLKVQSLVNPFLRYWDTQANGGIITYSFYQDNQTPYTGREQVSELTDPVKRNVRQVLSNLESALNVRFVEVEETATDAGVIRYLGSDGEGSPFYAYTYYPGDQIGGDVHLNANFVADGTNSFGAAPGSYGYRSIVHETLHALGLKHPGDYDAGTGMGVGPYLYTEDDNSTNTIMSYNVIGYSPITPMDYDLAALQYLYGGRSYRAGATTYQFSSLSSYKVGGELQGSFLQPAKQVLWDTGGQDTLDFSQMATASSNLFDLRPGGILTMRSAYNSQSYTDASGRGNFVTSDSGIKFANETLIENVVNSRGNDYIVANRANNRFLGYRLGVAVGNDAIELANSNDVVALENYRLPDVKVAIDQNDLVLNLAGDGTVRLFDYMSLRNPARIQVGNNDYVYAATGWQLATALPIG